MSKLTAYVERQLRGDAGVLRIETQLVFLLGGLGVVAQALQVARDVGPVAAQIEEVFLDEDLAVLGDTEGVGAVERADAGDAGLETMLPENEINVVEIGFAHLDHGAEFLVEESPERIVEMRNLKIDAGVAGKGHFGDGGEEAAVGAVVVGEKFLLVTQLLDGVPEIFEIGGIVHVGRGFAHLGGDLGENGTTEAVLISAEIDQEEDGVGGKRVGDNTLHFRILSGVSDPGYSVFRLGGDASPYLGL